MKRDDNEAKGVEGTVKEIASEDAHISKGGKKWKEKQEKGKKARNKGCKLAEKDRKKQTTKGKNKKKREMCRLADGADLHLHRLEKKCNRKQGEEDEQ